GRLVFGSVLFLGRRRWVLGRRLRLLGRRLRLLGFSSDLGGLLVGLGLGAFFGLVLRGHFVLGLGHFFAGVFGGLAATAAALLGLLGLERFRRRRRQLGHEGQVEREHAEQGDRCGGTVNAEQPLTRAVD